MKRLVSALVSALILVLIYTQVGSDQVWGALTGAAPLWVIVGLSLFVPQVTLTAWRFKRLMPADSALSFGDSLRLILAAGSLNMVLPSKMGDLAKAWFMARHHAMPGGLAASLVVFEKAADMLALLVWCVFGLLLYPQKDVLFWGFFLVVATGLGVGGLFLFSDRVDAALVALLRRVLPARLADKAARLAASLGAVRAHLRGTPGLVLRIAFASLFLWFLHLAQIWLFVRAVSDWMPFLANLALAPLAILAGLMPLTFAGIGTRDAAVVLLYAPYLDTATGAALGVFFTVRYLLPALFGLPYLHRFMPKDAKVAPG